MAPTLPPSAAPSGQGKGDESLGLTLPVETTRGGGTDRTVTEGTATEATATERTLAASELSADPVTVPRAGPRSATGAATAQVHQPGAPWGRTTGPVERLVGYEQRYEEGEELGRGGLGRVFIAHDRQLGREVAIKELHSDLSSTKGPGDAELSGSSRHPLEIRFLDEARVTAQLEHPGILPVYELGQREDGSVYYAMRRVRGRTLAAAIRGRNLNARLEFLPHYLELCHAIAYAHSRGVIHRDLKPDNVMLGDFGETVVLDWGLAKVRGKADRQIEKLADGFDQLRDADALKTVAGQALGTPAYMPPEQARGDLTSIDERSDVYSLGAILYEILTGRPPHQGKSVLAVLVAVTEADIPAPQTLAPDVPPELAAVARRALSREPEARYPSARELAEDLRRFQVGGLVRAHEYSLWDLTRRWLRRHRAALLIVLGLLVAVAGAWWYRGWSGERQRRAAEKTRQAEVSREVQGLLATVAAGPKSKNWLEVYAFRLIALREPLVERALIAALGHPEERVRRVAARALGGMKSTRAVPALIARLEKGRESSETVVVDVINALGIIGDSRADRPVDEARFRFGQHGAVWKKTALAYLMIPLAPLPAKPSYDDLVNRGRSLTNKDRSREAIAWFDRATARDPTRTRALVNRAVSYLDLGESKRALADFDRTLVLDPGEHKARHNRALIYRRLRRYDDAIRDLTQVVQSGELPVIALRNRAWVYRLKGELALAEADLVSALAKAPDHVASRISLATLLLGQGRLKEATAEVERALHQQPRYVNALSMRAEMRRYSGDLSGALADAEVLIALDGALSWGYRHRARVRLARRDRAGAEADFAKAVALEPRDPAVWVERAIWLHVETGAFEKAESDLQQAVALAERKEKGHQTYYEIYRLHTLLRMGKRPEARRAASALRSTASRRASWIVSFLQGTATHEELERALVRDAFHRHYVSYYEGLKAELAGDLATARAAYARVPRDWFTKIYVPGLAQAGARTLADHAPRPGAPTSPAPTRPGAPVPPPAAMTPPRP